MGRADIHQELQVAGAGVARLALLVGACGLLLACADTANTADGQCTPRPANTPLFVGTTTSGDGWTVDLDPGLGPYPGHRPDPVVCAISSYGIEDGSLEVDTEGCNFLLIGQPLAEPLRACEELTATVAHFPLVAAEPAEAHVALSLGDEILWEKTISIPQPQTGVFPITFRPAQDIPAGTMLTLHLHNHGSNTWYLSNLRVGPPAP